MITFLQDNFDSNYQLRLSGTLLTIKEPAAEAELKEVRVDLNDHKKSFAFVMDRNKKKHCDNRNCDEKKRDECNNLHSKVCNFLQFKPGLHKACDAIIVTCEGNKVFFTICELKSKKFADTLAKFKMAKALISYLCEAFATQNCQFFLQFVAFKIDPNKSRHYPTTSSHKEPGKKTELVADNFGEYSLLSFSHHEAENKPQVTLKRIQEGGVGEASGRFYTCSWDRLRTKPAALPASS